MSSKYFLKHDCIDGSDVKGSLQLVFLDLPFIKSRTVYLQKKAS